MKYVVARNDTYVRRTSITSFRMWELVNPIYFVAINLPSVGYIKVLMRIRKVSQSMGIFDSHITYVNQIFYIIIYVGIYIRSC